MKGQKTLFSHESDEWETPDGLYNNLNSEFRFTLDPCATEANHKCEKFYTKEQDGLRQSWENEVVFVNPPYSEITKWVEKASYEHNNRHAKVVMLLPARTDTRWFHNYIYGHAVIRFIRGRLKFNGSKNSAPFPSMIVIFE